MGSLYDSENPELATIREGALGMPLPPRCSDSLPAPLKGALVVRTWECTPPPEKWLAIHLSEFVGTPVTQVAQDDIRTAMQLAGYGVPEKRFLAFRGNWRIQTVTTLGVVYWRINQVWMTQVRDARLLGCCQQSQDNCYQRSFD